MKKVLGMTIALGMVVSAAQAQVATQTARQTNPAVAAQAGSTVNLGSTLNIGTPAAKAALSVLPVSSLSKIATATKFNGLSLAADKAANAVKASVQKNDASKAKTYALALNVIGKLAVKPSGEYSSAVVGLVSNGMYSKFEGKERENLNKFLASVSTNLKNVAASAALQENAIRAGFLAFKNGNAQEAAKFRDAVDANCKTAKN